MKLRICCFSVVCILVSMLSNLGVSNVNEQNLNKYIAPNCVAVADFIEDNFASFVDEYNSATNDNWKASSIEKRHEIVIDECGDVYEGVFVDFNDDYGYAVVVDNYELLDFTISGSSPFKGIDSEKYFYSSVTGYFYLSGGNYLSVSDNNNTDESFIYDNINAKHYDGQEETAKGCGKIENTDKYIKSRYGSGWKLDRNISLEMRGYTQYELSCYIENRIQNECHYTYSEGNCWVVSAYNVLQYLADTKWNNSNIPKSKTTINYNPAISEPNIYLNYFDSKGNNKSNKLYYNDNKEYIHQYTLNNTMIFPKLYCDIRKFVNDKYKQINNGGSIFQTSTIIESIAKQYNINVNAKEHVFWGYYLETGTKQIDKGIPLLWSTSNDTYGSHTMAVCGYKRYSKKVGWWIFKVTQYKLFYELRDGHTSDPRFYDMTGHLGFSAIISVEI